MPIKEVVVHPRDVDQFVGNLGKIVVHLVKENCQVVVVGDVVVVVVGVDAVSLVKLACQLDNVQFHLAD